MAIGRKIDKSIQIVTEPNKYGFLFYLKTIFPPTTYYITHLISIFSDSLTSSETITIRALMLQYLPRLFNNKPLLVGNKPLKKIFLQDRQTINNFC